MTSTAAELPPPISRRDPAFGRMLLALTAAGIANFAVLYCVQPLLPLFTTVFDRTPAEASLAVSVATGVLAAAVLVVGVVADRVERRRMLVVSLTASSLLTFVVALAPSWPLLLAARAASGIALAGVPGVALTYIAEEMDHEAIGLAVGLHIAGNTFGGMCGRLATGVLAQDFGWRPAVAVVAAIGLGCAVLLRLTLPASRRFRPRRRNLGETFAAYGAAFRDRGLPWLYLESFLLFGSFVAVYNYIGFRLLGPPYNLDQTAVGLIFALYLLGVVSSPLMGELAGRLGRRRVFWPAVVMMAVGVALTAARPLALVVAGVAFLTFGFFAAHSVASSWVARRAGPRRAQAAALYLLFYYLGASVIGYAGGIGWSAAGWGGVVGLLAGSLGVGLAVAISLAFLKPLPGNAVARDRVRNEVQQHG